MDHLCLLKHVVVVRLDVKDCRSWSFLNVLSGVMLVLLNLLQRFSLSREGLPRLDRVEEVIKLLDRGHMVLLRGLSAIKHRLLYRCCGAWNLIALSFIEGVEPVKGLLNSVLASWHSNRLRYMIHLLTYVVV